MVLRTYTHIQIWTNICMLCMYTYIYIYVVHAGFQTNWCLSLSLSTIGSVASDTESGSTCSEMLICKRESRDVRCAPEGVLGLARDCHGDYMGGCQDYGPFFGYPQILGAVL